MELHVDILCSATDSTSGEPSRVRGFITEMNFPAISVAYPNCHNTAKPPISTVNNTTVNRIFILTDVRVLSISPSKSNTKTPATNKIGEVVRYFVVRYGILIAKKSPNPKVTLYANRRRCVYLPSSTNTKTKSTV